MKQLNTEVAIIAAGTAGMSAAIAAAENGAKVIAFEKSSTIGGAGNMAMGPFAVESKLQRLKKLALTREAVFKTQMEYTHWRVDARLVKAFINKSASTIDWLEAMGVEFDDVECHNYGFNFTWHTVKMNAGSAEPGSASVMMKVMTARAQKLGVKIFLRTPVKKILKKNGRIIGLMVEDDSGEEIEVKAEAVVIATGGFLDNPDMVKKYTGYEMGRNFFPRRIPGLTGDGIRMAWEAGASPSEMILHRGCGLEDAPEFFRAAWAFNQPNLMVNLSGERFFNEEIAQTTPFGANPVAREKDRCSFAIFDEDTKKYYEEFGFDFLPPAVGPGESITKFGDFDAQMKRALDEGFKKVFVADSLEEIASKAGINTDNLRKTVDEYNKACETGRDELFYKNPKYLRPIKTPKFYAGKLTIGALGTLGGIRINHKAEVLNESLDAIPGLYAAGNDANSINGDTYIFIFPGSTLGFAINSGRIAGESAAGYVKSRSK